MKFTIRQLNEAGEYETIFHINMTEDSLTHQLTHRENDVVRLLALGYNSNQIAENLFISQKWLKPIENPFTEVRREFIC